MALNSFLFLLGFLPIVVLGAHLLRRHRSARAAQSWILLASLVFYSWDRPADLLLLLASIAFNWAIATALASSATAPTRRRQLFAVGLSANVVLLGVFKYANAVSAGLGTLLGHDFADLNLGFPLGISFFTLTQIMYLVDCYEGLVPSNSLFNHATFVSFFPNVTAGPLIRAKLFIGQLGMLAEPLNRDERLTRSAALVTIGLFKKVVLGDSFAQIARAGFANVGALSTLGAWLTMLSGTFEMYFDFSGYSDMAFGAAGLLGVTIVRNFNAPFRAVTISDFWRRWHISLSQFITTYLYTPLLRLMGRASIHKSALATLLAMAITGLWHGAAWTFLLFYTMHGAGLAGLSVLETHEATAAAPRGRVNDLPLRQPCIRHRSCTRCQIRPEGGLAAPAAERLGQRRAASSSDRHLGPADVGVAGDPRRLHGVRRTDIG